MTIISPGVARIKATQDGNYAYNAAEPVEVSFCVNPSKPIISASDDIYAAYLTSSNVHGNQWYRSREVIDGAVAAVFNADESGSYTVITTVEGCFSLQSESYELIIAGIDIDPEFTLDVFPNPAKDAIHVHLNGHEARDFTIELFDCFGRMVDRQDAKDSRVVLDATNRMNGMYILKVTSGKGIVTQKVMKE